MQKNILKNCIIFLFVLLLATPVYASTLKFRIRKRICHITGECPDFSEYVPGDEPEDPGAEDPENDSIHFTSSPIVSAYEAEVYIYVAHAISSLSENLTFSLLEAPTWLTDFMDNGDGSAQIGGLVPGTAVTGEVPPIFTSDPGIVAYAGNPYTYWPVAEDYDRTSVLHMSVLEKPDWVQFYEEYDSSLPTGYRASIKGIAPAYPAATEIPSFSSSPITQAYHGLPYHYSVSIEDTDKLSVLSVSVIQKPDWLQLYQTYEDDWVLALNGVPLGNPNGLNNTAPTFTSSPITDGSRNTAYSYTITATDSDKVDVLNLTGTNLPSWLTLSWNGQTNSGLLSGTAPNEAGSHTVSLRLTDGGNAISTQNFTISIP